MPKKTQSQLDVDAAIQSVKKARADALAAKKQKDKDIRALAKSVGIKIPQGEYYTQDYSSVEDFKSKNSQWFDPNYEQPDYGSSYTDPKTGEKVSLKASTPEVQAVADILKKAYQDWRAANKGKYKGYTGGTPYTWEEAKKYLPKGFKDPQNWEKNIKAGLDVYDQFGNIIPKWAISKSSMGDLIQKGTYVAPNVMAASMGMPDEEVNRILQQQSYYDAWVGAGKPQGAELDKWRSTISLLDPSKLTYGSFGISPQLITPYRTLGATTAPSTTTTTSTPTSPGTTTPAGATAPPGTNTDNITDAAKNLANAKSPTVPQFIKPYESAKRGFGAFGERDIF